MRAYTHRTVIISIVALLLGLIAAGEAQAQGIYLDRGQSGTSGSVGVMSEEDATQLILSGGYSHEALVDLGLSLIRYRFDDDPNDVTGWGIMPNVNLHLLRQSSLAPISVMATASAQRILYRSDELDRLNTQIKSWIYSAGGGVYRSFRLDGLELIPQVTLAFSFRNTVIRTPFFTLEEERDTVDLSFTAHLVYRTDSAVWVAAPQLVMVDEDLSFGVFLGAAFF